MKSTSDQNKKMQWGEEPEFFGPRHYFRESMIIRHLKKRVAKESKMLDAGSGNGSLTLRIGQCGYQVMGIDASDAFISYAGKMAKKAGLNGSVTFRKGDVLQTGLEDASFDAVVSGEVLEHLEQDTLAVREFYRILRKGGYCIVTVPAHPHLLDRVDEWAGHYRRYTKEELEKMFVETGFSVEKCCYYGFPFVRMFHQIIFLPMAHRKINRQGRTHANEKSITSRVLKNKRLHRLIAFFFNFDNLFNYVPLGMGLLLVARKKGNESG